MMDRSRLGHRGGCPHRTHRNRRQGQAYGQGTASNGERIEDRDRFHERIAENKTDERVVEGRWHRKMGSP